MNKTFSELPLIRTSIDFLSKEICEDIINYSVEEIKPGKIINEKGLSVVDKNYRSASTFSSVNLPHTDYIRKKVSEFTGYNENRFEEITVIKYKVGEKFDFHQDYFITHNEDSHINETNKRCSKGGNRVSTVIIYLNDVELGGETYFPWITWRDWPLWIKATQGKLVQFNYNYDEWEYNIRSQHTGMEVLSGEKWIITIWIREESTEETIDNYKKFKEESNIFEKVEDVIYEIESGPHYDRRTLTLTLPGNDHPTNTILVAYTGGMESTLLLYLLGMLNNYQTIPYKILPITINQHNAFNYIGINEPIIKMKYIRELIVKNIGGNIQDLKISGLWPDKKSYTSLDGVKYYLEADPKINDEVRWFKFGNVYVGDNQHPTDEDPRWEKIGYKRKKSKDLRFIQPFLNLQKYHILDIYLQLGLEYLLEEIGKQCSVPHKDVFDPCAFPCEERRWAFHKLDKLDLAEKYFLNKVNT